MSTNFYFLKKDWSVLAQIGEMAEYTLHKDPNTAIIKTRQLGEYIAKLMIKVEKLPEAENQIDRIKVLKDYDLISDEIEKIFHKIRKAGNIAVHDMEGEMAEAEILLSLVVKLCGWFNEVYGSDYSFSSDKIEYRTPEYVDYKEKYEALLSQVKIKEEEFKNLKTEDISHKTLEERKRIIKNKKPMELTEEETRVLIDEQLKEAGWEVNTPVLNYRYKKVLPQKNKAVAIAEWPCRKENGDQGWADYALFYKNILYGVIEAKKMGVDVLTALNADSSMYAKGAELREEISFCEGAPFGKYKVPFMFSSNGRAYNRDLIEKSGIWFLDGRKESNLPKSLKGFYAPEDLEVLMNKDENIANKRLTENSIEYLKSAEGLGLRYYQAEAIEAVEKALVAGRHKLLLTMATGTGKTRTALALIYRLLKSKKYNRILFVVDRASLGEQANDTFKNTKIEEQFPLSKIYEVKGLEDKFPEADTKVHIVTIQGLIKRVLFPDDNNYLSVGKYDCIIIDEAHRGYVLDRIPTEEEALIRDEKEYQSKYRNVIEYFDADKIALTATPALHTYDIFGEPVYEYSYRQAVLDGYLVDFEPPYRIITKLSQDGIHYEKGSEIKVYDSVSQEVKKIENLEDELNFDITNFNTKVITEGFNRAVCKSLVTEISPEGEEKTLIFAANDEHADMIVRILKEEYNELGIYSMNNDMIEKITGSVKDVNQLIRKFKNDSYPTIAVTVDLLTTGIDVPKICNLVFLRKIKSRILYEQMIGRATRPCEKINKEYFRIYDAVGIYEDLEKYSDMKPVVADPKTSIKDLFKNFDNVKDDEKAASYLMEQVVARLQRKKNTIKKGKENDIKVLSGYLRGEEVTNIDNYLFELKNTPDDKKIEVLEKEKNFLIYLDSIKKNDNYKVIADDKDEVISFKQDFGKNKTLEDYLLSFKKYIKENEDKIEALKILKRSPKTFTKENLKEIKLQLDAYGYSKRNLNTAYQTLKNEDILIDIISFVKYAITENDSDLISRDKKIERVMEKIKKLNRWNKIQGQLLNRIEVSLKGDEYITKEDFNDGIFKRKYGGAEKVDKILQGKLDEIMDIIYNGILLN
ncbi:type I restriction-modification system endonuclease [Fusobacterium varium]|uniref:type I restriction-modification system endonuclease n=1 Tax=Fusobacterium varium TaxID=856 RepID=UPI0035685D93